MSGPSIGQIVHYVSYGECHAAIVTAREPTGFASLTVFTPNGTFHSEPCDQDEDKRGGTWHWAH
jgi:hypothetical protein